MNRKSSFSDDATLKNFEKIAREKGWIEEKSTIDTIIENKKSEIVISDNLNNNLLTLCSALKNQGFDKYAQELEEKVIDYTTTKNHLYQVHGTTGDDMINFAHPGPEYVASEASDELANIETILSAHKKIVDVATKPATGKLGSRQIVSLISLALDASELEKFTPEQKTALAKAMQEFKDEIKLLIEQIKTDPSINLNSNVSTRWGSVLTDIGAAAAGGAGAGALIGGVPTAGMGAIPGALLFGGVGAVGGGIYGLFKHVTTISEMLDATLKAIDVIKPNNPQTYAVRHSALLGLLAACKDNTGDLGKYIDRATAPLNTVNAKIKDIFANVVAAQPVSTTQSTSAPAAVKQDDTDAHALEKEIDKKLNYLNHYKLVLSKKTFKDNSTREKAFAYIKEVEVDLATQKEILVSALKLNDKTEVAKVKAEMDAIQADIDGFKEDWKL